MFSFFLKFWRLDTLTAGLLSSSLLLVKTFCFFPPSKRASSLPLPHSLHEVLLAALQQLAGLPDLLLVQQHQRPQGQVELGRVLEQAAAHPVILQSNQKQGLAHPIPDTHLCRERAASHQPQAFTRSLN